jgi:hypothetical protein
MTLRATSPDRKSGASPVWPAVVPLVLLPALFVGRGGKDARVLSLAVAGVVGILAWSLWSDRARAMGRSLFLRGVAGFVFWQALAAFLSPAPLAAWRPLAGASLFAGTAFLLGRHGDARHRLTWRALVVGGGLVQAVAWGTTGTLPLAGNPQYAAFWAAMSLFIAVSPAVDRRARPVHRAVGVVGTLASLFLLWSLPVRSGWMAALAGGLLWGSRRFGRRGLVGALVAGGLALAFVPARVLKSDDATAFKRVDIWRTAWRGILQKPLAGWGPGQFESLYARHALPQESEPVRYDRVTAFAHNDGLQVLAETGWPGGAFVVLSLWGLWRAREKGDAGRGVRGVGGRFGVFPLQFSFGEPDQRRAGGGNRRFPMAGRYKGGPAMAGLRRPEGGSGTGNRGDVVGRCELRSGGGLPSRGPTRRRPRRHRRAVDRRPGRPDGSIVAQRSGRGGRHGRSESAELAAGRPTPGRSLAKFGPSRIGSPAPTGGTRRGGLRRGPGPQAPSRALVVGTGHDRHSPERRAGRRRVLAPGPSAPNPVISTRRWLWVNGGGLKGIPRAPPAGWPPFVYGAPTGRNGVRGASGYQRAVLSRDERGLARALALCYIDLGRFREALVELDKTEMDTPETWALRALALSRAGRPGDARAALRRGRSLAPEDPRWEILMKKIAEPNRP